MVETKKKVAKKKAAKKQVAKVIVEEEVIVKPEIVKTIETVAPAHQHKMTYINGQRIFKHELFCTKCNRTTNHCLTIEENTEFNINIIKERMGAKLKEAGCSHE